VKLPAGKALSKAVFRGTPPNPTAGSGTFFLDDVTLMKLKPMPMLSLVRNGRAVATIVVPANPDKWTSQAAAWLQEYVQKASGARLPIVTEENAPSGTLISVGHTRMAAKAGVEIGGLKWDGCKLVVKGDVLYLIGRDDCGTTTHDYVGARGTCRAVIRFLEEVCGVRWFLPSPEGELVPRTRDIRIPADFTETFQPAFAYSDGRSVYDVNILDEPGKSLAALANNYRKAVKVAPGGHSYYHAVPMVKYFKDHPEYYALIDGKRSPPGKHEWEGHHLCSTNPEVKDILVQWMRMRFDQGLDWASLGQEDGYVRCQCPACEAMDDYRDCPAGMRWEDFQTGKLRETPCERVFFLHKAVIDEIAKSHPDKMVMLMCYAPTTWPSKKIKYFGDNVIAEVMDPNPEVLEAWRDKVAGIASKVDWFNTQCPMGVNIGLTPRETAERIRYLHENGVVGLAQYAEGNWGLQGPTFYALGRLMGDPSLDHEALVEEYCRGVYGKAGATMLEFFNVLYTRLERVLPLFPGDMAADGRNFGLPRRGVTTTELYISMYPPEVLRKLEALLDKAGAEADTRRAKGWLRLTRDYFDFTNLLTRSLISYRAWQADPTAENWQELKRRVEAFDACRTKILTYPQEYTDVWFPGHMTFCKWMIANLEKESTAYYSPWAPRKAAAIKSGVKGRAMGYGTSYYYSFIKEPLTFDFSKPMPKPK